MLIPSLRVWQHVQCMGLNPATIPEEYLCETCEPRKVDRRRARAIQRQKREELGISSSDDEDLASSLAGGIRGTPRSRRPLIKPGIHPGKKTFPSSSNQAKGKHGKSSNADKKPLSSFSSKEKSDRTLKQMKVKRRVSLIFWPSLIYLLLYICFSQLALRKSALCG